MKLTMEKIGNIGQKIAEIAPLAEAGIAGAVEEITKLIDGLHGDWKTALDAANATGHEEVAKLHARAADAQAWLDAHKAA